MYLTILSLPFLSSISSLLFGRFFGERGSEILAVVLVSTSFFISLICFFYVGIQSNPCFFKIATWFDSGLFFVSWGFLFDSLTVTMLVVVTCVSSIVHIYSIEYMRSDPHKPRFLGYLSLFTFFMLVLVSSDNFIQMFFGWEGIGLSSYLIINFWFTRIQANKAAIQAMLVNRVGDFFLSLGIFAIFLEFKSVDYLTVFASVPLMTSSSLNIIGFNFNSIDLICIFLFLGAVGKSAQIGLHVWLPCAMEGPTPVSALIHAATLVTAGVFLLVRCSPIFEYSPNVLVFITIIGSLTAFFAATTGILQNDIKKVIAYSTCSQIGYMVFACGLSSYSVGVFHLANHAFFKALLFLSAGCVIHSISDEQDLRKMGGLLNILPFTYSMFFVGSIALMGLPFLAGFYSKDVILEVAYAKYSFASHFSFWLGSLGAFFTSFYSLRLIYLTFLSNTQCHRNVLEKAHDAPVLMALPLLVLSFGSLFIGYLTKELIIGLGTSFWGNSIFVHPNHLLFIEAEFIPQHFKVLPVFLSILGGFSGFVFYNFFSYYLFDFKVSFFGKSLYTFLNRKWFFDKIYCDFIIQPSLSIGFHLTYKIVDRGLLEMLGPFGVSNLVYFKSVQFSRIQTGFVYHYTLVILLGSFLFFSSLFYEFLFDLRIFVIFIGVSFLKN